MKLRKKQNSEKCYNSRQEGKEKNIDKKKKI